MLVRDYKTVAVKTGVEAGLLATRSEMVRSIIFSRTVRWVCIGAAAQLIAVSALWSWLPSFLNRTYGIAPDKAGAQAAVVVLAGAFGSVVLGAIVDWAGTRRAGGRFSTVAVLSIMSMVALMVAFGAPYLGVTLSATAQFGLILLGGFLAPCTAGPAAQSSSTWFIRRSIDRRLGAISVQNLLDWRWAISAACYRTSSDCSRRWR